MRAIMPDEIQLSSCIPFKKPLPLIHQYNNLAVDNEQIIFKKYLHSLTYDISSTDFSTQLKNEEVHFLKQSLTLLYRAYKGRKIHLSQLEGVWHLLTFKFTKLSGLQLYLAFQKLIEPIQRKQFVPNQTIVKEQELDFDRKKFFQNSNIWLHDKKFMNVLRVIERYCAKSSYQNNINESQKILQIIFEENVELLMKSRQFAAQFQAYKTKAIKICADRDMLKKATIQSQLFNQEQLMKGYVMSDPGDFKNILLSFEKKDFINIQSYQHEELRMNNQSVKSLYNHPIKQETSQKQISSKKMHERTEIRSSPTKRRIAQDLISNQFNQTPSKTRNLYHRPPRFKFIERLYNIQKPNEQKKQKLRQIKKQQEKIKTTNYNFFKIQKRTRRRLKKIDKSYYSDQEKNIKHRNTSKKEMRNQQLQEQFQIEQSEIYSSEEVEEVQDRRSQRMEIQSSESVTMRRKRPTKIVNLRLNKRSFMEDENVDNQSDRFSDNANQVQEILLTNSMNNGNSKNIGIKQCPDLNFLKMPKLRQEQKYSQSLQNLTIRMLELNDGEQIHSSINISEYVWYLQSLEEKQIEKQIKSVCKQLLIRQYQQLDIDLHIKILGLFIMSEDKRNQHSQRQWTKYKHLYIDSMLKHCISVTIYSALSQILNNLTVDSLNQDLTSLSKTKRYFHNFFQIINFFDCRLEQKSNPLFSKFVKLLYEIMPNSTKIQAILKNSYNHFLINLEGSFKIGSNILRFKLSPKQQVIAFTISAFIFEKLILHELVKYADNFEAVRKQYLDCFINGMKQFECQIKEQIIMFNNLIKTFYKIFQPQLDKNYFSSLVNLIIISLQNLNKKINDIQQKSKEIKAQSQFLEFICRKYLQNSLKDGNFSRKQALSIILISTKINKYKVIDSQNIQSMIIYPRLLASLWNYNQYRINNKDLETATKKYIENLDNQIRRDNLQVRNKLVTESLSYFLKIVYKAKLYQNLSIQNTNFSLLDLQEIKLKVRDDCISYDSLRKILAAHFTQLDKYFEKDINYDRQCKSAQLRNKSPIKNSQLMLIQFLNNFLLLQHSKSEENCLINQESVLKYSVSHYFFCLKFILEQNFFLKYYKYKIHYNLNQLYKKCSQIVNFFFGHHPTFIDKVGLELESDRMVIQNMRFQDEQTQRFKENARLKKKHSINEQLTKQYYKIIKNHFETRKNMEIQVLIINQAAQPIQYNSLGNIYSTYIISCIDTIGPKQTIVNLENPMTRNISESIKNVNSKKVQKAIYFLACIFRNLQYYIKVKQRFSKQSSYTGIKSMQSQMLCRQIKKIFYKNFLDKHVKQIVILITCGFCLKHSQQFSQLPVDKIIESFSNVQLLERNMVYQKNYQQGSIHFLYAINCLKTTKGGLSDILNQLLMSGQSKTKEFNNAISQTISQICRIMKQLLKNSTQRPLITIQSLKILIFIVKWEQLKPQCIKMFLHEMQVFSKGQSLILKIPVTQKNIQIILELFQAVEKCKYNYFKIKQIPNEYIDLLFKQEKFKDKQKQFCTEVQKILRCLHQISNIQSLYVRKAMELIKKIVEKFLEPVFKWQMTQSTNISKRIHIFYDLLRLSQKQLYVYQSIVIANRQAFQKLVRLHRPCSQITNFQQFVQKFMIGEHSNFLDLKALISGFMRQNVLSGSKKDYFVRVISKLKQTMEKARANPFLIQWCQQESVKLKGIEKINQDLNTWMDLQQQ